MLSRYTRFRRAQSRRMGWIVQHKVGQDDKLFLDLNGRKVWKEWGLREADCP